MRGVHFRLAQYSDANYTQSEERLVGRCRLKSMKPMLKAPGTKRLKLSNDELPSNFDFE